MAGPSLSYKSGSSSGSLHGLRSPRTSTALSDTLAGSQTGSGAAGAGTGSPMESWHCRYRLTHLVMPWHWPFYFVFVFEFLFIWKAPREKERLIFFQCLVWTPDPHINLDWTWDWSQEMRMGLTGTQVHEHMHKKLWLRLSHLNMGCVGFPSGNVAALLNARPRSMSLGSVWWHASIVAGSFRIIFLLSA